jgi:hypothetical protein
MVQGLTITGLNARIGRGSYVSQRSLDADFTTDNDHAKRGRATFSSSLPSRNSAFFFSPEREVLSAVPFFYYKAYDEAGNKRTGIIEATHHHAADVELRKGGLRPYFVHDYQQLKKVLRQRQKKRQRSIAAVGTAAVILSAVLSGLIVRYAGRERAPRIEDYRRTGLVEGSPGLIVAKTKAEREFALEILDVWESFAPDSVRGVEVGKLLMWVHVTRKIRSLPHNDLEVLASQTVRALQREFGATVCTLHVMEGDAAILEVRYNAITRSTRVKSYR